MSVSLRMETRGYSLVPMDPFSEEKLGNLKPGQTYNVEVKNDRSRGDLNLYWAGLSFLLPNVDESRWPTSRKLHNAIMEHLGYVEKLWRIDGTFRLEPDSIAMDNMDETDFTAYFERAKALVIATWGVDPWEEWKAAQPNRGWRR